MKKFAVILVILAALSILLSACAPEPVQTAAAQTPAPAALIVEGRLEPVRSSDQAFSLAGQVAEVLVSDGETVITGQPLARLVESPEAALALARAQQELLSAQQALDLLNSSADLNLAIAKVALEQARAQLDDAQARFDEDGSAENRVYLDAARETLKQASDTVDRLETGFGVDADQLAAAQARLDTAYLGVNSAQAFIDAHILKAAMDGVVVDLALQKGDMVAAGAPVIVIADGSAWVVKTDNLTEAHIASVEIGQKVEVVLDALPGTTLPGEVTHINARYEEKRGDITFTTTIRLSQDTPAMRWGMTAAVYFLP